MYFACFSLLRFVLLDCLVCLVKRFVVFIIFAALQECCFRFLSADGPLLFLLCQASDVGGRGIDVVLRRQ